MCQAALTRETVSMQSAHIYNDLQGWLVMDSQRQMWKSEKNHLHSGELSNPVEGPALTVVSHVSLYQETKESAIGG